MAPVTSMGLIEPSEEELQQPFDVITGHNLRPSSTEHSDEQETD